MGLFPHLSNFNSTQNTALLDVFDLCGDDTFRLTPGARVLFAFGEPTVDLIEKLISRCLSGTRSYCVLENLLEAAVFPIQKHWSDVAGTRILDLWLILLSRLHPLEEPKFPIDEVLPVRLFHFLSRSSINQRNSDR